MTGSVDGYPFVGTLLPNRHGHYLVYNRQMKELCKKGRGEPVHAVVQIDSQPRTVAIADDVRSALDTFPAALSRFMEMAYYLQREEINRIDSAKTSATRERRIAELVHKLTQG